MKKLGLVQYLSLAALMFGTMACEMDNLEAPAAAITGTLYDHNGLPLQIEQGKGAGSIRITELSWLNKEEVVTSQELNVKFDGSYRNDKLFAATYLIHPYKGAFYPLDSVEMKTIVLKNGATAQVDFNVTPYLEVEWASEPEIVTYAEGQHPDGKPAGKYFKAEATFKRVYKTVTNEAGEEVMLPHPSVKGGTLCVGNTHFVSANNRLGDYYSTDISVTNTQEGQTIRFIAKRDVEFSGQEYYLRIGFKSNDTDQKYNYTTVKHISLKTEENVETEE
ncbi:MAG: hypothetical protein EZS26_001569 [Candidatus Ordinivivax streblomastigis]|uniref:DUF3823 domain-containing protein n=1 Tax=Candidatus Ordinivivax streblomastigis TaxID=2540710 RepID=A0A5M8P1A2_9BACT|nr:MAG: hypothetical protein EZS26_001569 [Candidatus Ordinivivax streblomastigis]